MPKRVAKSTKRVRKVRGKGAYYPGGMTGRGAYYPGGRPRVLRGRGGFFDDVGGFFKKAAGPLLGVAGGIANTIWPGSGMVADGIRKLVGAGAYTPVRSNAILAQPVPRVNSAQDYGITYSHQEYLGDVTGSTDWELTQFHVNPGLPETFPWLAGVASNFQKYRIDGLVFYLRSTSSVAIANTENLGLGTVMGGFQTNVYDKAPGSKLEFLSLSGARSGKPSEDHIFPMECDRTKNVFGNLLVRTVGVPDDLAKYDHAVFNLATVGFPGAYYLGELWVSYKLTLMAPKVESSGSVVATLPITEVDEEKKTVTYQERFFDAIPLTINGGVWLCTPPLDDPTYMWNSLAFGTSSAADGYSCMTVPAGTAGYFMFTQHNTAATVVAPRMEPAVLENTGSIVQDNSVIKGFYTANAQAKDVVSVQVYRIQALPDKPMLLRWGATLNDETGVKFNLDIVRLPDRLFANSASASTVSLAQKVQRIQKNRLTEQVFRRAASAASTSAVDLVTPPTLLRGSANQTPSRGNPLSSNR